MSLFLTSISFWVIFPNHLIIYLQKYFKWSASWQLNWSSFTFAKSKTWKPLDLSKYLLSLVIYFFDPYNDIPTVSDLQKCYHPGELQCGRVKIVKVCSLFVKWEKDQRKLVDKGKYSLWHIRIRVLLWKRIYENWKSGSWLL